MLDHLPDGLLETSSRDLSRVLGGPTLIHLDGEGDGPPLFVSCLLHGNEPAGLYGLQRVLRRREMRLPRPLSIFIGNVHAAREGRRRLKGQPDFNRIWQPGSTPEHRMAGEVLHHMRERGATAVVDIHNNTGRNPHYSIVTRLTKPTLELASRFDPKIIYAPAPRTVLAHGFHKIAPAATLECGTPWDEGGYEHAAEYVDEMLEVDAVPADAWPSADRMRLYQSVAVIKVPPEVRFGFDERADLVLRRDLDTTNFEEMTAGTPIARVRPGSNARLVVLDPEGADVTARWLTMEKGRIVTAWHVVPSMFSLDETVIRQDCLGYILVERTLDELLAGAIR